MVLVIVPYTADLVDSVKALNQRLSEHGVPYRFPENETPGWLPQQNAIPLYHEYFVARDEGALRGGYIFKNQEFLLAGGILPVGFFRLPISEGLYDRRYTTLAAQFLLHALKKNAALFSLGIGGYDEPLAKLERGAGWTQWTLSFHFLVLRANRFLANIEHLRRKPSRRLLIDIGRFTGVGATAIHMWQTWRKPRFLAQSGCVADRVAEFGAWADDIWYQSQDAYSFIAVRDSQCLTALYPINDPRFIRLQVSEFNRPIGWAVVMATALSNHKHFGNMKLGSIVDCLAIPGKERQIVAAATNLLRNAKCDLIVSNQSHKEWCAALDQAGYLRGPSNFIFSASKKLAEEIDRVDPDHQRLHLTRGDGDGPIHL